MNFNEIMKSDRKYKCVMINNGDYQKVANLKNEFFGLEVHSGYFCNAIFLINIQKTDDHIILNTNKSRIKVKQKGIFRRLCRGLVL